MSIGGDQERRIDTCPLCQRDLEKEPKKYFARHLEEDCPETGSVEIEDLVDAEGSR